MKASEIITILALVTPLISSLIVGLLMFKLESRREKQDRRREDYRLATNWKVESEVSMRNFDLTGANLSGHKFIGADLEGSVMNKAEIWAADFTGANLRRASFARAKLVGVQFTNAKLLVANFNKCMILKREDPDRAYTPNFSHSDLSKASFRNAYVESASFENAKLVSVDFTSARLSNSVFTGADLTGSKWNRVRFENCVWKSVIGIEHSYLPENLRKEIQSQN